MAFKLVTFSFDDTQKKASVAMMEDNGNYINCIINLKVQEDESIEGIKRKAMSSLKDLIGSAIDDVLKDMPERPASPQA